MHSIKMVKITGNKMTYLTFKPVIFYYYMYFYFTLHELYGRQEYIRII